MANRNSFSDLKDNLSQQDIDQIVELVGYRCRSKTLVKLRARLEFAPGLIPGYGIFQRLTKENNRWEYTAGQSYPDEIRTLRECILE